LICGSCGTENEAGRKFCKECAAPLAMVCGNCGTSNAPDARFCGECASPLRAGRGDTGVATEGPGTASGVASPAPVAERRLVSVLFADLVGFTPFSEERDPEETREVLSRWFDVAGEIVARYGGTVEKFIGDAVMAVWGAPTAHEDDAERAVRAGLEIVDAVHNVADGIQARAGVLTGEAAVTLGRTNEGLVAGDLVNTASRLQSVAPPGGVLVGEATHRAASRAIAFEEAGEQVLKGKASPIPAWRALRVVAERGGRNRTDALEPPFVGRQDELRLLKDLFHATGRERRIRLVSVMGPAGIGKSRLAREFVQYGDGLIEDVYYHSGRSPAYGEGVTFWALGEMVRGRCGLLETDDAATTRQKVADSVARYVPDAEERNWIEPALLMLLGIESEAASEQLFGAWRTYFERIAAQGTVALVFEDFHFADAGLIDFVDHLLEWSKGLPIYVITLARPELLEKRPDWGAGKRNFVSLALEPLTEDAMRELLAGLVPGLPERTATAIVARADGIPLYAVETVRMLLADGRLREEDGSYTPVGDLTELAVPGSLVALIGARLDALEPTERSLLQDAAVLGQSFTQEALSAVSGVEPREIESRLLGLVRREVLSREGDPRSPEHGQFAFVQALIREVAYSTLARRDRKARHLASARYFESLGTDELAGALASHYLAAHANAPDGAEADALATQARLALKGAAERASNLGAFGQAVTFLEQALTVTSDPSETADILERAGDAARTAARHEMAQDLLRRAVDLRRQGSDRIATAGSVARLGEALLIGRQVDRAEELLQAALAEFADLAPDPALARIEVGLARAMLEQNRYGLASEIAERVLDTAEQRGLVAIASPAMITKGSALAAQGRKREGIAVIRAGGELARENSLHETAIAALIVGGFHSGDLDQAAALEMYREGLALSQKLGHRDLMLRFVNNIGYTAFLAGDWDEALEVMDAALREELDNVDRISLLSNALIVRTCRGEPIADSRAEIDRLLSGMTDPQARAPSLDTIGNEALTAGNFEIAGAAWRELCELDPTQTPEFRYRAGRAAAWAGDLAAIRSDLEAIEATGMHGRVVDARRTTLDAALAAVEGRGAEALALYRDAQRDWRELRQPWDEALTGIDMVKLLDPAHAEVRRVADATREILTRLGAVPYLEHLDAALARTPGAQAAAAGHKATEDPMRSDVEAATKSP
jgi:class 3 adenylate cyclase/predicted ATPase